jgi:carboxyl-terminal processing protease
MEYNNNKRTIASPLVICISLAIGIFIGAKFFGSKATPGAGSLGNRYREVLMNIKKSYVDEVNTDSLEMYALDRMLEKLDPHTVLLPPQDAELASAELGTGFDGIGVEFNIFNDSLFVVSPLTGGPSEAIGIKAGDIILQADSTARSQRIECNDTYQAQRRKSAHDLPGKKRQNTHVFHRCCLHDGTGNRVHQSEPLL